MLYRFSNQLLFNQINESSEETARCFGYPCQLGYTTPGTQYQYWTVGEGQLALEVVWTTPAVITTSKYHKIILPEGSNVDTCFMYSSEKDTIYNWGIKDNKVELSGLEGVAVDWMVMFNTGDLNALQYLYDNMFIRLEEPAFNLNPNARDTDGKYYYYNTAYDGDEENIESSSLTTIPRYSIAWININVTNEASITSETRVCWNNFTNGTMEGTGWTVSSGTYNGRETWVISNSGYNTSFWRFKNSIKEQPATYSIHYGDKTGTLDCTSNYGCITIDGVNQPVPIPEGGYIANVKEDSMIFAPVSTPDKTGFNVFFGGDKGSVTWEDNGLAIYVDNMEVPEFPLEQEELMVPEGSIISITVGLCVQICDVETGEEVGIYQSDSDRMTFVVDRDVVVYTDMNKFM